MPSQLIQRWNDFWFTEVSAKPMGIFRILYGLIVITTWLPRGPYISELYSNQAWHSPYLWYTWGHEIFPPSLAVASIIYWILLISAVMFLAGWHTRTANFILLVSYTYLVLVESNNLKAYDRVMILEAVAMLVSFPQAAFSLDSLKKAKAFSPQDSRKPTSPVYGAQLLLFLLSAVYFFVGLKKAFFTPHWWDGGVLLYALLDRRNAIMPIGVLLTKFPTLVALLAGAVAIWEVLFPFMAFYKKTKLWWLLGGLMFHLGIQSTINVGPFNGIMIATYVALLPLELFQRFKDNFTNISKRLVPLVIFCFLSPNLVHAQSEKTFTIINAHEHFQTHKNVPKFLKAMKQNGVVKTVIVGSPEATILKGRTGFTGEEKYNLEVLQIANADPEHFIAFPTINVKDPEKLEKFKGYLKMGGKGLKLYNGHSNFHDLPLDDPTMLPVYEYCEKNRIPILFHVNAGKFQNEFESVLQKYPNLKVICPHFCLSTIETDRFEYLMDRYPNLYTDLSMGYIDFLKDGLIRFSKHPKKYRKLILKYQDRIFFGTDMVVTSAKYKTADWLANVTRAYRDMLEKKKYTFFALEGHTLNGLHLDRPVLEKIYHANFEKFFDLSSEKKLK